jgi:putative peptide zinc metalloprotease protein
MRRRIGLLLAAALTAASMTWTVHADTTPDSGNNGNGGNNNAVAINTHDGKSVFSLAFSIVRAGGDSVTNSNIAFAYASCTSCETVAIAFQVVLITGDPSVIAPTNEAVAINYMCTLCTTFADAVQFVISTPGPVTFTSEGWREIAEIRRELEKLRHADLPIDQLAAAVEQLRRRLATVLATQLVLLQDGKDDAQNPSPSPSSAATHTPVSTSTATASPAATATPSSTSVASPASTATATP